MSQERPNNPVMTIPITEKVLKWRDGDVERISYDRNGGESRVGHVVMVILGLVAALFCIAALLANSKYTLPLALIVWMMLLSLWDVTFVEFKRPKDIVDYRSQRERAQIFLGHVGWRESKKPLRTEGLRGFSIREFQSKGRWGNTNSHYDLVAEYQSGEPIVLMFLMNHKDASAALRELNNALQDATSH